MATRLIEAKYRIIPEVMRFCLTSPLFLELDAWVGSQAEALAAPTQAEYSLRAMDVHQRFVQQFELGLESFIVERGCSVSQFMRLCQSLSGHNVGGEAVQLLLELLHQLTSFTTFVELARDEGKRKYIKQILLGYAAMLPQ